MKKYNIGLYEKALPGSLSWEEKLQVAKELGYDYIEISIDETDEKLTRLEWTQNERQEMVCLMYRIGLPIRSMCLSGHRKYPLGSADPQVRARGMEIMEKAIQLADDLGIRIIQLAGYDVYYEESTDETVKLFAENLKTAVEMAASKGIQMGFETMETPFMDTTEKAMKYVDMVGSPYLGVYPDIGNMTNAALIYGRDVLEDMETGHGHIMAMHLKETVPGKYREIRFGTGHVDFEAAIEKALELGVRRFVTEMWYVGQDSWKDDIKEAIGMMTKILEEK